MGLFPVLAGWWREIALPGPDMVEMLPLNFTESCAPLLGYLSGTFCFFLFFSPDTLDSILFHKGDLVYMELIVASSLLGFSFKEIHKSKQ